MYNGRTSRQLNSRIVTRDKECEKQIIEMREVEKFLGNFGYLNFGRDIILCGKHAFSLQAISTSRELTLGSVISCCESACIADGYSLLRKYRDDMFFYLYIVIYDSYDRIENKSQTFAQMEVNIERWMNNDLNNLYIGTVLKDISQFPRVRDAVEKYNLRAYYDEIGVRLNNYVHGNGASFYNRDNYELRMSDLRAQLQSLKKDMNSITITFLFLLILCSPLSIMSTDYEDYLDFDMEPPKGSQYWVAPFITDYIKNNIDLIDKSCMEYLQDNVLMEFD